MKVPRAIEMTEGGFVYTIPVWCGIPVAFRKMKTEKENLQFCPIAKKEKQTYSELKQWKFCMGM